MNLGGNIMQSMQQQGRTKVWLAEQTGINYKTLVDKLKNNRIDGEDLLRIARAMEIDLNALRDGLEKGIAPENAVAVNNIPESISGPVRTRMLKVDKSYETVDLAGIKKLEDLKKQAETLSNKYHELLKVKIIESIKAAILGFRDFFASRGFIIGNEGGGIYAAYGKSKIILFIPGQEDIYIGAVSLFRLTIESQRTMKYLIPLNVRGCYARMVMSEFAPSANNRKNVENEIEVIREWIDYIQANMQGAAQKELCFGLVKEGDNKIKEYPQFQNVKELLTQIFN